LLQLEPLCYAD
jgi:hypothetical protein